MGMHVRGVPFLAHLEGRMDVNIEPPSQDSFFFRAFNANIDIANAVIDTQYLQAMKVCKLNPQDFGCLTVQDAYYCYLAADTLRSLLCKIDKEKESELYNLANSQYEGYIDYNKTFLVDWHIHTANCVTPTDTFKAYAEHEHHVMCAYDPIYTLVALLPCYYLWPWFGKKIKESEGYAPGVYHSWFDGCWADDSYFDSAYAIGNFIEAWKGNGKEFDEDLAMQIFQTSMKYELAVFSEAYHESIEAVKNKK